jgi:hypothetical protein
LKLKLKNESVAGATSGTDSINTGTKAKTLDVTGLLPFSNASHLTELLKVAEAIDTSGARLVYNISDDTANTADIRQVIFDGNFNARKVKDLNAWSVSFTLQQKNSNAEAKEKRVKKNENPVTDTSSGKIVTSNESTENSATKEDRSWVYQVLKKLDNELAPDENS